MQQRQSCCFIRPRSLVASDFGKYLSTLVLERGLGPDAEPEVKRLARTRTIIALRSLDADRNGQVIQFLRESELLYPEPVVDLTDADLSRAKLSRVNLSRLNLSDADLSEVDLRGAIGFGIELRGVDLRKADLSGATLIDASLLINS